MKSDTDHDVCGMSLAIDVVGGKWKLHLMWVLGAGPQRFGQIRRLLDGVSEKVLTENLRQLEGAGVVHREVYPEIPPRVEYSLTPLGETLRLALEPLENWGDTHRAELAVNTRPSAPVPTAVAL
ncbi:transcriptional regulator [Nocardia sp. MH4]|uniref:winged helix-turn-helix transcriptional regulator n=1 Tax=Nocardia sp. MH4 TaxID=1768677 RepID=UPI001C4EFD14|nr:helix-turn-helix domain-containing protein [Nocardia sp. MH4]MBW0272261.1 transcriptional regulator [Nocardia sp. MH4]